MKKLFGGLFVLTIALIVGASIGRAADGEVLSYQKISDTEGNFSVTYDDQQHFGISSSSIGDLNGDGVNELAVGAEYTHEGGSDVGSVFILFLDTSGSVDSYVEIADNKGGFSSTELSDNDTFGHGVAGLGDVNGDGVPDVAVSARGDDTNGTDTGAIYILFLNSNGTVSGYQKIADSTGGYTGTLSDYDAFGESLASAGDLDGDGVNELVVGFAGENLKNAIDILFIGSAGTVESVVKLEDGQNGLSFTGSFFGSYAGTIGDLDGDGIPDIGVGTSYPDPEDEMMSYRAITILYMNANGTVASQVDIGGSGSHWYEGYDTGDDSQRLTDIEPLGDINGDEVADFAIGSASNDLIAEGNIFIFFMNADGTVQSAIEIEDNDGGFGNELTEADEFGASLANIGDLDGNDIPDLFVGASLDDDGVESDGGAGYILFLDGTLAETSTGSTPAPTPPSSPLFNIVGDSVCTWDNTLYAEVEAAQTVAVYVADNERFVSSQQYIYQSGNAAAVLPEELQSSANPSKMYISWTIPEETREESIYELFALARGTNGALSAIVTDSIEYSSVTDCDYPFAAERDAEGNIVSTTPGSGNGGEETESAITPVSPGNLIKVDGDSTVYYVTQSLTKRPFTEYSIYLTWGGDSALKLVTPATLPTLQTGEPMLPKGPAIIYFEGNPNPHYIDGASNAPREQTVENVLRDLLGAALRPDLHQTVPAYLEDQITKGTPLTRANELTILREWRNFIRGL